MVVARSFMMGITVRSHVIPNDKVLIEKVRNHKIKDHHGSGYNFFKKSCRWKTDVCVCVCAQQPHGWRKKLQKINFICLPEVNFYFIWTKYQNSAYRKWTSVRKMVKDKQIGRALVFVLISVESRHWSLARFLQNHEDRPIDVISTCSCTCTASH